jgi:serine/threonine protein kinase
MSHPLHASLQIAATLTVLAADNVAHFDLKGANVLVAPHEGVRDGALYGPPPLQPPCAPRFSPVLADFGEVGGGL